MSGKMVSTLYIVALAATFAVLAGAATDYCKLKSCKGSNHTICQYGLNKIDAKRCGRVKSSTLTKAEMESLLRLHNEYRHKVASGGEKRGSPGPQPAARNLGPLKWDKELANIAQSWANQCNYRHDHCRNSERFPVGQNIAYGASTRNYSYTFSVMVTWWYDEVALFDKNQVKGVTKFKDVGHYTQMMWADTKLLGCGGVRYNSDGRWHRTYLVCNYGPTGNWVGQPMYQTR